MFRMSIVEHDMRGSVPKILLSRYPEVILGRELCIFLQMLQKGDNLRVALKQEWCALYDTTSIRRGQSVQE
jgi:hypothetical protein